VPPAWTTDPTRVAEIQREDATRPLPLVLRTQEFGMLDYGLPSSGITVLRDGVPQRMRASVVSFIPVPPQGRDSFQTMSRRILLVWTPDRMTEGLTAVATHSPAAFRPLPRSCCSAAQMRARRWSGWSELDVEGEQAWLATHGSVAILPPRLGGACPDSLRRMLATMSQGTAWCRSADYEVSLDGSYVQARADRSPVVIRTRGIAPVRVRGAHVLIDCARPAGKFDDFCGPQ
jgi:hypothetical protein